MFLPNTPLPVQFIVSSERFPSPQGLGECYFTVVLHQDTQIDIQVCSRWCHLYTLQLFKVDVSIHAAKLINPILHSNFVAEVNKLIIKKKLLQ